MKIYCSGIGGIGLSAYASLQLAAGHDVIGSDRSQSALLEDLRSQGITIVLDQSGAAIPDDTDLFVYSEAIPVHAPERVRAKELGITQQSYPEALGELSSGHSAVIAVCGTHGKSSTTGMATRLLMHSGRDPTVVVGTKLHELGGRNWRKGRKDGTFLLEACEYRHSFYNYHPSIILMTNCDGDHFDFYTSLEDYRAAFVTFLKKLPADGVLITHLDDPGCAAIAESSGKIVINADTHPLIPLKTPGKHMQQNAQLVLALADHLQIPPEQAQAAVSGYAGSWRRLERKGLFRDEIPVIDDYAHHPREITASLEAIIGEYPGKRIVCVFQPHTHDRTLKFYDDFTTAFRGVDTVIIPNIYEARKDIETERVDLSKFLKDIAKSSNVKCIDGKSLKETERLLKEDILKTGDVLVCMGAGDITNVATCLVTPIAPQSVTRHDTAI
ncbi:MAG: hypothetical protein HOO67_06705 [Candidatus Peribacteraceae bacterium]|nr:hypothetical protein [Candidatus Peribacteraceae bacterium]